MDSQIRKAAIIVTCFALLIAVLGIDTRSAQTRTTIKTKLGIEMILIPAGEFMMGNAQGGADEKPVHKVKISAFYMDTNLVTQQQYEMLMRTCPARWKNPNNPVEQVRWSDAVKYLNARSQAEGIEPCYDLKTWKCDFDADGYRLPTEAEWEYACRAGTRTKYFFANDARSQRSLNLECRRAR